MKSIKQRVVLTDYLSDANPQSLQYSQWYELDPLVLFSKLDWTKYEEDVQVNNQIYSEVFDEIVVSKKSLLCYWPFDDFIASDWFELQKLFGKRKFELEFHKKENEYFESSEISKTILKKWKGFVVFLLEALLEDIAMNDHIDQIATLTNDAGSIVLFRLEHEHGLSYSFASTQVFFEQVPVLLPDLEQSTHSLPLFDSFVDLLENLMGELDLEAYKTQFSDKQLEKTYYNWISKEFKIKNLIQNWLTTYSLN
ncbi:hypothetical protein ACFPIK_13580 [Algoriphagus aquatilis]|uniref:Uncharacterized protein n=1 Tax=Algoriphagus aquatilis TaxID=490186 RepID=A0ABW0BYH2_9BACT